MINLLTIKSVVVHVNLLHKTITTVIFHTIHKHKSLNTSIIINQISQNHRIQSNIPRDFNRKNTPPASPAPDFLTNQRSILANGRILTPDV